MIQGGDDRCVDPGLTEGIEASFTGRYRRAVLNGVGHFSPREAPEAVATGVIAHLENRPIPHFK